jgi:RNA polymerase sigma-70 factor (ECF subfamily)
VSSNRSQQLDVGFEQFVASASPGLLRSAYLLVGDHAAAEDLLQSALLGALRRWDSISGSPTAYTFTALVNLSRDRFRAQRRRRAMAQEHDAFGQPAADQLDRLLERDAITRAARRLPDAQRQVLACRFLLDLTVAETADALGLPEGTVKSYTARALAGMRRLLGGDAAVERSSSEVRSAE